MCGDWTGQDHTRSTDFRLGSTRPWSKMQNFIEYFSCRAKKKKNNQKTRPQPTTIKTRHKENTLTLTGREGPPLPVMAEESQVLEAMGSPRTQPPSPGGRQASSWKAASPGLQRRFALSLWSLPLSRYHASIASSYFLLLIQSQLTKMTWTHWRDSFWEQGILIWVKGDEWKKNIGEMVRESEYWKLNIRISSIYLNPYLCPQEAVTITKLKIIVHMQ